MTNTDLSRDDNAYFASAKNTFREHYNSILRDLQAAEKAFRNLIVLLLKDQQFPEPKVSSRIKEREECINKFVRKYREDLDKSGTDYVITDYITDIIGLRVVCYYESDVDDAVTILKDQLKLLEETNKTEELEKMIVNLAIKEHT
jgi:ppGpp synthetase/RelA/SpoT-type nucleotidyltranferase